jgi:hypothetical protein
MRDIPLTLPVNRTLAVIMGGGAGTRLFPLTKQRAKPAVHLAGKYRLVDIPISNCLNPGIRSIYVLTQFNSMSLHRHINNTYKFDKFTPSFVEILAAQQRPGGSIGIREQRTLSGRTSTTFSNVRSITISFLVATSFTGWTTARSCASTLRHVSGHHSRGSDRGDGLRDHAYRGGL